jgi:hypothetical protein
LATGGFPLGTAAVTCGLVRAGSAGHRELLVLGGHEWSRRACTVRRSLGIHRPDLRPGIRMGPGSNPSVPLPRACRPCQQAGVTEDGPHPRAELVPSLPGPSHVHPHRPCPRRVLSIGRQRSFTDNKGRCMSLRAVGSLHTERSEGASQARGSPGKD